MNAHDLILVIDMQNAYLPGEPWGCETFHRSRERIETLLRAAAAREVSAFFTVFFNDPDAPGMWKVYNEINRKINDDPWMREIVDDLKPYAARLPVYRKSVYSSMAIPEVERAAKRAERLVITGVVSECCVLSTCMAAIDLGCHIVYLRDACSGIDRARENATLEILDCMSPPHVTIMDTGEYLAEQDSD